MIDKIKSILGKDNESLLSYESKTIPKDMIHLPGKDFIDRVWMSSDRTPNVLRNMQSIYNTGRLANTGYVSILPVDQGLDGWRQASPLSNHTR